MNTAGVKLEAPPPGALAATLAFGVLALSVVATGCGSNLPYVWVNDLSGGETSAEPIIQPRDSIQVDVQNQIPMSGEFLVRDDGHYTQPPVGSVRVEGLTPTEAARIITIRLKGVIIEPRVAVWITKTAPARVNVVGEVRTPGTYELTRDKSVLAALSAGGWLNEFASKNDIYVVRTGDKPMRIRFRLKDLIGSDTASMRFRLREGDSVVVE